MSKIGLSLKINVSKIQKDKMFKGDKGVYLDATIFVDLDQVDQHGNSGMITQSWKDAQKGETPILGNGKIFWREDNQRQPIESAAHRYGGSPNSGGFQPQQQQSGGFTPQNQQQPAGPDFDDDIPF